MLGFTFCSVCVLVIVSLRCGLDDGTGLCCGFDFGYLLMCWVWLFVALRVYSLYVIFLICLCLLFLVALVCFVCL